MDVLYISAFNSMFASEIGIDESEMGLRWIVQSM